MRKYKKIKSYRVFVEKTATGYSAYSNDMPGVISTGANWQDIKANFQEAFEFHLEGLKEEGEPIPEAYQLAFSLDIGQLFEYYKVFNVTALSGYLNINAQLLHQYKDGRKIASEKTSLKILKGLHSFGKELLSAGA